MSRANWYYEHPPACTCVACSDVRRKKRVSGFVRLINKVTNFLSRRSAG